MEYLNAHKAQLQNKGFTTIASIYSAEETAALISAIENADSTRSTFRKSKDLFAIRQFLKEIPQTAALIFNENLKQIIRQLFGEDYFVVKSIYFDKPEESNWFVSYHQDLTVSVDQKAKLENYGPWTVKQDQFAVQPPLEVLQNIFTIRIHLDDTNAENGALKVIPGSHLKEIYRPETIDWNLETETVCAVPQGGIMIMRPLLLHSSGRTLNQARRRVIHIEFSNYALPKTINWAEKMEIDLASPVLSNEFQTANA